MSSPGALRTKACDVCSIAAPTMHCACEDAWICWECALAALHAHDCPASAAAVAGHRAGRDDYPPA